jgi:HprK-related kinase A
MPALRPISLKNESIDIIRRFAPDATIGPVFPRTRKGSVAHFAPDAVSAAKRHEPATPALIVFPRFRAGAGTTLEPMPRSQAFTKLAANSFNYEVLGPEGFEAMGRLIERCACFRLSYSRLEEAIEVIGAQLSRTTAGQAASQAGAVPAST